MVEQNLSAIGNVTKHAVSISSIYLQLIIFYAWCEMIFFDKLADKIELIKLLSALIHSYQKTEQESWSSILP